jgi:hypothetical protein
MMTKIDQSSYWFKKDGIVKAEEMYDAKHMGFWCKKTTAGWWTDYPVDVFYQKNPDTSKGHTHYLGLFLDQGQLFVTKADSAFDVPITGLMLPSGEVIVSRHRHHCITTEAGYMIDGGRDYIRYSTPRGVTAHLVSVTVRDGQFSFDDIVST